MASSSTPADDGLSSTNGISPTRSQKPAAGFNERFFRYFQHEVTALQEQMGALSTTSYSGGERNDAVDHCLAGIARLSHEVKDASTYLPAFDQRTYAEAVKALSEKLQAVRASFAPRPKFTFKSALKTRSPPASARSASSVNPSALLNSLNPGEDAKDGAADAAIEAANKKIRDSTAGTGIRRASFSAASSVSLSNHKNAYIVVQRSASHAAGGLGKVTDADHCVVDLEQPTYAGSPFPGLTVRNVSKSLLLCGKVSGAIHMTNLQDCVLVVACRQFRMHECKNVIVYLHCGSRPIIEDCERVRFTPLPEEYVDDVLRKTQNQWDQVDDFKWLKSEPSPNWSVLPQDERLADVFWSDTLAGGGASASTVDGILELVGIAQD